MRRFKQGIEAGGGRAKLRQGRTQSHPAQAAHNATPGRRTRCTGRCDMVRHPRQCNTPGNATPPATQHTARRRTLCTRQCNTPGNATPSPPTHLMYPAPVRSMKRQARVSASRSPPLRASLGCASLASAEGGAAASAASSSFFTAVPSSDFAFFAPSEPRDGGGGRRVVRTCGFEFAVLPVASARGKRRGSRGRAGRQLCCAVAVLGTNWLALKGDHLPPSPPPACACAPRAAAPPGRCSGQECQRDALMRCGWRGTEQQGSSSAARQATAQHGTGSRRCSAHRWRHCPFRMAPQRAATQHSSSSRRVPRSLLAARPFQDGPQRATTQHSTGSRRHGAHRCRYSSLRMVPPLSRVRASCSASAKRLSSKVPSSLGKGSSGCQME